MPKPTFIAPDMQRKNGCDPTLCLGCGREIKWAYALCLWCREQRLEDVAAESDTSSVEHHRDRDREYNRMRIVILPRNRDGSLREVSNYDGVAEE